jgi:ubiquinone/menaquinone biosynthesis C-methylase UbiE
MSTGITQPQSAADTFDAFNARYADEVQQSIDFSGLSHQFFLDAKVALLDRLLAERLPGAANMSALDIGCGVGAMHGAFASRFARLAGVDVSSQSIERAREAHPANTYLAYDGERLPFADGAFDVTMTTCVVHHVPPAQWPRFTAEMRRVTRPGGMSVIIEHNPFNPLTRLAVKRCAFDADAVLLSHRKAANLMKEAGFSDLATPFFLFLPMSNGLARAAEKALRWLPLGAQYAAVGRA